ncbi:hypothetical protein [Haloplanus natans]|uniref:hypothetical protein n=1 Tax=Haloplanus natans TaxID=376171 RepID=UPI0006775CDF|nr:hypothetical protein [Haloplanus natans]
MDPHTFLTVGFVVLVAAVAFVTARVGAVAIGVLPPAPGVDGTDTEVDAVDDAASVAETADGAAGDEKSVDDAPAEGWDADRSGKSRLTADDLDRIRSHLAKDRFHRRPDDLRPSDDERS